jgi:regulation of enolase protein 1 (concanavalin A-like superfamily)
MLFLCTSEESFFRSAKPRQKSLTLYKTVKVMKSRNLSSILLFVLAAPFFMAGSAPGVGIFQGSDDVGDPLMRGSASFDPATGIYTLTGAGFNMWDTNDQFHFLWRKETGDFSMSARIAFEGEGVVAHRKMGIMIRESMEGNSECAYVAVHGDGLTSLQYRTEAGRSTSEVVGPKGGDHIMLERRGNRIVMRTATGRFPQDITGETEFDLAPTCYVGIFICSHADEVIEKGRFFDLEYRKAE